MHVCTTRACKGWTQIKRYLDHGSVYYISFLRWYPSRRKPVGAHRGGVDIYYYSSGHIAPYCVPVYDCCIQSHFLAQELAFYVKNRGEISVCSHTAKHCTCTHAPLNRTAPRTEDCPTLVLGVRSACSPVPSNTHITGCCSIAY